MDDDPLVTLEVLMSTPVAVHAQLKEPTDQTVKEFVAGLEAVFRKAGIATRG